MDMEVKEDSAIVQNASSDSRRDYNSYDNHDTASIPTSSALDYRTSPISAQGQFAIQFKEGFDNTELPLENTQRFQRKGNSSGLPYKLKMGIENLSGYSMDDVNVHYNSSQPAQHKAHAFARGTDIHIAPRQEKHLPHEAWHVVQKKQGRVNPETQLKSRSAIYDDTGLEKEADIMGVKALQMPINHSQRQLKNTGYITDRETIQPYLIVDSHDYTHDLKVKGGDDNTLENIVDRVMNEILKTTQSGSFLDDFMGEEVHNFLQENAGNLVRKQLTKWVADEQGTTEAMQDGKGNRVFGRKNQARVYRNYADLARALYGWVSSKPNRHREKRLAQQVYASPIVDRHINSVLTKMKSFYEALGYNELPYFTDNQIHDKSDYRNWFNHLQKGVSDFTIPGNFNDVLAEPDKFDLRTKIAVMHDIMRLQPVEEMAVLEPVGQFKLPSGMEWPEHWETKQTIYEGETLEYASPPMPEATVPKPVVIKPSAKPSDEEEQKFLDEFMPREPYDRPESSILDRDSVNHEVIEDATEELKKGPNGESKVRASTEETHPSYQFARENKIPMWGRHSYTAYRMMNLAELVESSQEEVRAVADAIMAFWRLDYDHRHYAYHTLHEIQDFTQNLGLGRYDPLTRYEDMHRRLDALPELMNSLLSIAVSLNTTEHKTTMGTIVDDLQAGDKSTLVKLASIKKRVPVTTNESDKHKEFYAIVAQIPDDILTYEDAVTDGDSQGRQSTIAITLSRMLKQLSDFTV